jgi:hypothetical protein
MKLSPEAIKIAQVFEALLTSIDDIAPSDHDFGPPSYHRRVRSDLPRNRNRSILPIIPPQFDPLVHSCTIDNQKILLQLAAFEATYHDTITPISPDMVPLVKDTGASVTVTPYATDFIGPITPVQEIEIKGIAAGLQVKGTGTIKYQYYNDNGDLMHLLLPHCLYVPQCSARLLCPRQIGALTGHPADGFYS